MRITKKIILDTIRTAFFKGELSDLENVLIDEAIESSPTGMKSEYKDEKANLMIILRKDIQETKDRRFRLAHPNKVNYYGAYLRLFAEENELPIENISESVSIESSVMRELMDNRVDITEIQPSLLALLSKYLKLSLESSSRLIRNAIQLFNYGPSYAGGMARYDSKKGEENKGRSMRAGIDELRLKASSTKPGKKQVESEANTKTEAYINSYKLEYRHL